MKLEFTKLIIRDFKDYRGKHVLDLVGLGFGLHFVAGDNRVDRIGSNGAGKSSLWDAFVWCITGRTVRGLRGTDVTGWHMSRPASVRLHFWVGDDKHWVKRSTKKNGLWLDGKLTSQEAIESLLRLDATTIPHTIILGQKRDLFFDLQPAKKMEVLSSALDLDKWQERSDRAKAKTLKLKIMCDDLMRSQQSVERDADHVLSQVQVTKALMSSWERERSEGSEKRDRELAKLKKALETKKTEQAEFDLAYDSAETELRALRKDLIKKQGEMDGVLDDISKARTKRDTSKAEYYRLKDMAKSDKCPTCGQDIIKHKKHAADAAKNLASAKRAWQIASDKVVVHETRKTLLRDKIVLMRKAEGEFGDKADKAKDSFDHIADAMHKIELEITKLKGEAREHDVNPYEQPLADLRKRYKALKRDKADLKDKVELAKLRASRTEYWVKGFKNIRLHLLEEALTHMQEVTNTMLPTFGLDGWTVQYDTEKVTQKGHATPGLVVTILKPGMTKGVKWEAWSGGEGQRLLIAGALAFSNVILERAGIDCDFIVLDEPTRHMSREGVSQTVDCLIEWSKDRQVFYTDHQAVESKRFASVVTITKGENGSAIGV